MRTGYLFRLAVAGIVFCSCQSDSYRINGYALHIKDGDSITLALEDRQHLTLGKTCVTDGHFHLSGVTDTTVFCRAYLSRDPLASVSFFLEPGEITLELNPYPKPSRVSGTELNNEWQRLNDEVQAMGYKLIRLAELSANQNTSDRQRIRQQIDSLHREISRCIVNTAHRNRHNVLGKYINANYKEPEFK